MGRLELKISELPQELKKEVEDYVEFLLKKKAHRRRGKPKFDWAGALKDSKNKYTSVELQHRISQWRIDSK